MERFRGVVKCCHGKATEAHEVAKHEMSDVELRPRQLSKLGL